MRATPETDDEHLAILENEEISISNEIDAMADFARKLERERDEAREIALNLQAIMKLTP
jgi:hypothetical protein